MTENREIHLEDLLAEQSRTVTLATVEDVPDKADLVRVTPWIPGRGCACRFALDVFKRDISKLILTEHRHHCCGKFLNVVEVEFKEGSVLPVADLFADLSRRAASAPIMRPRRARLRGRRQVREVDHWIPIEEPVDEPEENDQDGFGSGDSTTYGSGASCYEFYYQNCVARYARLMKNGKATAEQKQFCILYANDSCNMSNWPPD